MSEREVFAGLESPALNLRSLLAHSGPGLILMMTGVGTSHMVTAPVAGSTLANVRPSAARASRPPIWLGMTAGIAERSIGAVCDGSDRLMSVPNSRGTNLQASRTSHSLPCWELAHWELGADHHAVKPPSTRSS